MVWKLNWKNWKKPNKNTKKQYEKKIKDIENICKQKTMKERIPELPEEKTIKCNKCDYTTTSRQGLKIHNTKAHSKIDFVEFPAACDVCEKVLDNETKLKEHKKREHTYHIVKFQCNECEFMANEPHTLQVLFGINHATKKQCGLCDKDFNNSEELEEHLTECEASLE